MNDSNPAFPLLQLASLEWSLLRPRILLKSKNSITNNPSDMLYKTVLPLGTFLCNRGKREELTIKARWTKSVILGGRTGYNHIFLCGEGYYYLGILFLINYKSWKIKFIPKSISLWVMDQTIFQIRSFHCYFCFGCLTNGHMLL